MNEVLIKWANIKIVVLDRTKEDEHTSFPESAVLMSIKIGKIST